MSDINPDYITEAEPKAQRDAKVRGGTRSSVRKALTLAASFVIIVAVSLWLFIPYSTTPPSVSEYSSSEYFSIIEHFNAMSFVKPKYKNNFEMLKAMLSDIFRVGSDGGNMSGGAGAPEMDGGGSNGSYEEITDNQVAGVIEGDLVKRTDKYIFALNVGSNSSSVCLTVFSIDGEESKLISYSKHPLGDNIYYGGKPEMYLSGDGNRATVVINAREYGKIGAITLVISFDTSDVNDPKKVDTLKMSGSYLSSRMIGDTLLVMTKYNVALNSVNFDDVSTFVPSITSDGKCEYVSSDGIFMPDTLDKTQYTVAAMIDSSSLTVKDSMALLSYSDTIYVSSKNIYATRGYTVTRRIENDASLSYSSVEVRSDMTEITSIGYADGEFTLNGTASVEGYVKDQYSFDEYGDYLRVVTTTRHAKQYLYLNYNPDSSVSSDDAGSNSSSEPTGLINSASLYILNVSDLGKVGSVENFAPQGETVRSVRFKGNYAYVCTAIFVTDPVFFFDLSDPTNITYKDTGTIPGFSNSLIDFGDGFLLGIGTSNGSDLKIEVYTESESSVESLAEFKRDYVEYSLDYKSYYVDRASGFIGMAVYNYTTDKLSYILVSFDGYELSLVREIVLDGSYVSTSYVRGMLIDGCLYVILSDNIYVTPLIQ